MAAGGVFFVRDLGAAGVFFVRDLAAAVSLVRDEAVALGVVRLTLAMVDRNPSSGSRREAGEGSARVLIFENAEGDARF